MVSLRSRLPRPIMTIFPWKHNTPSGLSRAARVSTVFLGVIAGILVFHGSVALAHPLGNFTVNRYARLDLTSAEVRVRYVLDMAEIPTFQETTTIDQDRDGRIDPEEAQKYASAKAEEIRSNLRLILNGVPTALGTKEQYVSFHEGQGGLSLLRLEALFVAPLQGTYIEATFSDKNEPSRLGWREIVVRAGAGTFLSFSTAPSDDVTNELRIYPDDPMKTPMDSREARFSVTVSPGIGMAAVPHQSAADTAKGPFSGGKDTFALLATREGMGLSTVLLALLASAVLGAAHALTPGHGKVVVSAYLIGSRATIRQALFLGLTVTATHTMGVYVLGLTTLVLSKYVLPERLYPWLSLVSGLLVIAVGGSLLWRRLRAIWPRGVVPGGARRGRSSLPSGYEHYEPSSAIHQHEDHLQSHGNSHLTFYSGNSPASWRALLALGLSGGLTPCPSALLVMLSTISLDRAGFGLALIVAFSAGLATVLVGIGLLLVLGRQLLSEMPRRLGLPVPIPSLIGSVSAAGALLVLLAGLALTFQSLAQFNG